MGRDLTTNVLGEADMPKAARISTTIPASSALEKAESHPLVTIALFSGVGLLASLIAILAGAPIDWY
jgi:hypothetical protein